MGNEIWFRGRVEDGRDECIDVYINRLSWRFGLELTQNVMRREERESPHRGLTEDVCRKDRRSGAVAEEKEKGNQPKLQTVRVHSSANCQGRTTTLQLEMPERSMAVAFATSTAQVCQSPFPKL
jgi:hypothetical protein